MDKKLRETTILGVEIMNSKYKFAFAIWRKREVWPLYWWRSKID